MTEGPRLKLVYRRHTTNSAPISQNWPARRRNSTPAAHSMPSNQWSTIFNAWEQSFDAPGSRSFSDELQILAFLHPNALAAVRIFVRRQIAKHGGDALEAAQRARTRALNKCGATESWGWQSRQDA